MQLRVNIVFNVIQLSISHVQPQALVAIVLQHPMRVCAIVNWVIFGMDNDVQQHIHLMVHVQDNMLVEQILFVI
jgi:hypothetical protein